MKELTTQMINDYRESLDLHIRNVRIACRKIGVSETQAKYHDASKGTNSEFLHYARQFKGPKDDPDGFAGAWLHHIHNNPHHWQHWIFPDKFSPAGSNVVEGVCIMPEEYCMEMIADWLGSSKTYTGSWDMTTWLLANFNKVILHEKSREFIADELSQIGYFGILLELGYNPKSPPLGITPTTLFE